MLGRVNFQRIPKRSTSVLVTIPLSWGFVNDLRRSGYLSEQNSHDKERIGGLSLAPLGIGSPSGLIN
jgi:hypothetical protein